MVDLYLELDQERPTVEYLNRTLNRLTLTGAIFLALIATMPLVLGVIVE